MFRCNGNKVGIAGKSKSKKNQLFQIKRIQLFILFFLVSGVYIHRDVIFEFSHYCNNYLWQKKLLNKKSRTHGTSELKYTLSDVRVQEQSRHYSWASKCWEGRCEVARNKASNKASCCMLLLLHPSSLYRSMYKEGLHEEQCFSTFWHFGYI